MCKFFSLEARTGSSMPYAFRQFASSGSLFHRFFAARWPCPAGIAGAGGWYVYCEDKKMCCKALNLIGGCNEKIILADSCACPGNGRKYCLCTIGPDGSTRRPVARTSGRAHRHARLGHSVRGRAGVDRRLPYTRHFSFRRSDRMCAGAGTSHRAWQRQRGHGQQLRPGAAARRGHQRGLPAAGYQGKFGIGRRWALARQHFRSDGNH